LQGYCRGKISRLTVFVPFENLKDRQGLKTFAKADHVSTATDKKQEYRKNMINISAYASIASLLIL
jgi:hypothetical protein